MEKKSKAVDINELGEFGLIERISKKIKTYNKTTICLLYTSPSPRDRQKSRMPSSA